MSSDADPFTADAADLVARTRPAYSALDAGDRLQHLHVEGAHDLDPQRFNAIVEWLAMEGSRAH